jgi:hypothetical protein
MLKPNQPFVLLHHRLSDKEHWDLCLDLGAVLATWQILSDPTRSDKTTRYWPARRVADHRRAYLDYEGPISGGRGEVTRVDRGTWRPIEQGPITWLVQLEGAVLRGTYRLPTGLEPGEMCKITSEES